MSFTSQELMGRIEKLQHYLIDQQIDLAFLNTNADLYYYTGAVHPLYLIVPAQGEPVMLARKAVEQIRTQIPHLKLETFYGGRDLAAIVQKLGFSSLSKAAYTLDVTAYATVQRFQRLFGEPEIADISWDIRTLRMIKSEAEIAVQAKAGEVMAAVPQLMRDNFKPGMTELELSVVIEDYFRLHGHAGIIRCRREGIDISGLGVLSSGDNMLAGTKFDGICTGIGVTSSAPHGAGYDPIRQGVPVIIDFAFNLDGYHVDQTRLFSWGEPSKEVLKAYDAMCEVEQSIIDDLVPGKSWEEVYDNAVKLAGELGYAEEFMGLGAEKVRFVGHGVGVELDEPPYLAPKMSDPLQEGMVLAVEPKVSIPGEGVIGPEDTVVIRKDGVQYLTGCSREFIMV